MRKKDRQSCKMVSSFFRSMLTFFSQLKTPKHGLLSILSLICPAQTRPFILIKILNCFGGHVEMSLVSKLARPFTAHHWITGCVLLSQDTKDLIILNTFFIQSYKTIFDQRSYLDRKEITKRYVLFIQLFVSKKDARTRKLLVYL